MTYEVVIDGKAARVAISNGRIQFVREGGDSIEREYSAEAAGAGTFSVLMGERSYRVTRLSEDEISVNGRVYRMKVFDPRELRARGSAGVGQGRQTMTAPMPGRVVRVLVEAGQEVEAGQGLIVVEAMKMQNEMKSPKAGRVIEVKTAPGAAVVAGEVLLVIE